MLERKRATVILIGAISGVALVAGVLIGLTFGGTRQVPSVSEDDCDKENKCAVIPFNGSRYQITGKAFEAFEQCGSSGHCIWQIVNETTYMLEGEAYEAYLVLDNLAAPLHKIRYDSQYIGDRPYLINVDGPTPVVRELVGKYNILENGTKVTPDNHWTSFYGWIYQADLVRFLNENSVESLNSKSVTVGPVGAYTLEEGVTVHGIPAQIPDPDHFMAERESFIQSEMSRIVTEKSGVTIIPEDELIPLDNTDYLAREFG